MDTKAERIIADSVLYGRVITLDETDRVAEAVAVKDGRIVFVGTKAEAEAYVGEHTDVFDYEGHCIYPGFADSHNHLGLFATMQIGAKILEITSTLRQNAEVMKQFIEENPGREVYVGSRFWFVPGDPDPLTHEVLDKYASDRHPIVLLDGGGHSALLNQCAIEKFRLKEYIDVYGTDGIRVDENGEPTGYLVETPRFDLMMYVPILKEQIKDFFAEKQNEFIAEGFTAMCDAALPETEELPMVSALYELAKEGRLKLKVRGLYEISETKPDPFAEVEKAAALAEKYSDEYFKIIGIKVFLDGAPEALSAWTEKPYTKEAGKGENYHGYVRWGEDRKEQLAQVVRKANEKGLSVQMHAMGEAAVHYALDCFAMANEGMDEKDHRNGVAHAASVTDGDVRRFAENRVIAHAAPQWSTWKSGTKESEIKVFGEETARKMYRVGSLLKAGAVVSFHTDGMCQGGVPEMVFTAVTRRDPDIASMHEAGYYPEELTAMFPDEIRGENERVSGREALKCLTAASAYSLKEEKNIGSIEVGKAADFTVYDKDFTDDAVSGDPSCTGTKLLSVISSGTLVWPLWKKR